MMDNNKWYVLQVQTGSELDVQKELLRRGVEAVVPLENRQIHRAKQWISKQYIVFSGYDSGDDSQSTAVKIVYSEFYSGV